MSGSDEARHSPHPRHLLDPLLNSPIRLSLVACLAASDRAEFAFLRDTVQLSDSALSKQVTALEAAGYLTVSKGYVGKRPRTWLALTASGLQAFQRQVAVLAEIAAPPGLTAAPSRSGPATEPLPADRRPPH